MEAIINLLSANSELDFCDWLVNNFSVHLNISMIFENIIIYKVWNNVE